MSPAGDKKAFVIGWPIAHSRSPIIHNHWLSTYGLPGRYERVPVEPGDLAAFLDGIRAGLYIGGNVTIPHKEKTAALCDRLTPAAARLHAVNTVWLEHGILWGDTTDGLGFLGALDQEAAGWAGRGELAIVVGAGGAARAIVDSLLRRGMKHVVVANRTRDRAEALAEQVGGEAVDLDKVPSLLEGADLLVNTTSMGMDGQPPLDLDLASLPKHAVVDDIVYVPKITLLLDRAEAQGLRTVGGLGMLLHQAVPGFERWFGVRPAVTPGLRALVEADIVGAPR